MAELPPAFQFYAGDWLSSENVMAMTLEEEGAFIRLLAFAWKDPDCGISSDETRIAKLTKGKWAKVRDAVMPMFVEHPTVPGKLINPRLYRERERLQKRKESLSRGGQATAKKRWGSDSLATEELLASGSSSSSSSVSSSASDRSPSEISPPSPSPGESPSARRARKPRSQPCPFGEILDLFNSICLDLPEAKDNQAMRDKVAARWKESSERQNLEFWRRIFQHVHASDFLCGRSGAGWSLKKAGGLFWIAGKENLGKLINGLGTNDDKPPAVLPAAPQLNPKTQRTLMAAEAVLARMRGGDGDDGT